MFIREIWGNLPRSFFEILKSKFQKSELGKFFPNFPLKPVIIGTNMETCDYWYKYGFNSISTLCLNTIKTFFHQAIRERCSIQQRTKHMLKKCNKEMVYHRKFVATIKNLSVSVCCCYCFSFLLFFFY